MKNIDSLSWEAIQHSLNSCGFATIKSLMTHNECEKMISIYDENSTYRKTVMMERHRFGKGEYKYFDYPLPPTILGIRKSIYPHLVPIANQWMKVLKFEMEYPTIHDDFIQRCHEQGQQKPTPLILSYKKSGFNTLHQDLYGEVYFPFQLAVFLSEYGSEYEGGEFVLTEQIPRSQSKPIVLKPKKGDALIFATSYRPINGRRGYYRGNLRHGVSEVTSGERFTLGIIFHDATS
ncbi:2OG-Fe(II) oxygenase [Reichenbachiella sp.]|uniref:2OG-Fe(II) oxygenase n=1 Tax=Reichenbachiella sp. TaxID=2184521 RepID=UPI003BB142FF